VDVAQLHGRAHAVDVTCGGDHDDVRPGTFGGVDAWQQRQSVLVGKVQVEQHQIGSVGLNRVHGGSGGMGGGDDLEAGDPLDVPGVDGRNAVIVVDHKRGDHRRTPDVSSCPVVAPWGAGRTTVNTVPPVWARDTWISP